MVIKYGAYLLGMNFLAISPAFAADDCDSVLDKALMSQSTYIDKAYGTSALASSFCTKTFQQAKSSVEGGGGANILGFGDFNAQGAESKFNEWKQSNCGSSSQSNLQDTFRYSAQKALASDTVEAWKACKLQTKGLVCYAEPNDDPDVTTLVIGWDVSGTGKTEVSTSVAVNALNLSDKTLKGEIFAAHERLFPGTSRRIFKRTNDGSMTFSMDAIYNEDRKESCSVYVPPKKLPTTPQHSTPTHVSISGKWCPSSGLNGIFDFQQTGDALQITSSPPGAPPGAGFPIFDVAKIDPATNGEFSVAFQKTVRLSVISGPDSPPPGSPCNYNIGDRLSGTLTFVQSDPRTLVFKGGRFTKGSGGPECDKIFLPSNSTLAKCQ